ncbi:YhcU family protein [Priestia megaterium]|uniref:YhcU family protein n=1 Tax=Priestia megaterium TaxID=1404 RepID=UPI002E20A822|nr:YhcU family protein [Priestia megaterium]
MKIAQAAPPEMENYIEELTEQLRYDLLPRYVSVDKLNPDELLNPDYCTDHLYNGLLDEALQVISSLQTIIAVIEVIQHRPIEESDCEQFEKNIAILKKYGFLFPVSIECFAKENNLITYSYESFYNSYIN